MSHCKVKRGILSAERPQIYMDVLLGMEKRGGEEYDNYTTIGFGNCDVYYDGEVCNDKR